MRGPVFLQKTLKKNIKNGSPWTFYSKERHPASVRLSADVQPHSIATQAGRKQPVSSQPRPGLAPEREFAVNLSYTFKVQMQPEEKALNSESNGNKGSYLTFKKNSCEDQQGKRTFDHLESQHLVIVPTKSGTSCKPGWGRTARPDINSISR